MIPVNSLVAYKNKPAIALENTEDKIIISLYGEKIKVREKDVELIHGGPVKDIPPDKPEADAQAVREAWELLSCEPGPFAIKDLAQLIFNEYSAVAAWAIFCLLQDGLYFFRDSGGIFCRKAEEVTAGERKRDERKRESDERRLFIERLSKRDKSYKGCPQDTKFIQDVESLAFGISEKSRTMNDLGLPQSPEAAHALLLESGFWTNAVNPHPRRFGISSTPPCAAPPAPQEERRDLSSLLAYAIDSPWSDDRDDAVSVEVIKDGVILYVHVADPSSSVTGDSAVERESRDRGATLYVPEGPVRMMDVSFFAISPYGVSPALTFKITLDTRGNIKDTEIFQSLIKARCLTYEKADSLLDAEDEALCALYRLARKNFIRRENNGAINIEMPEVRISLEQGVPNSPGEHDSPGEHSSAGSQNALGEHSSPGTPVILPIVRYRSANIVKECMLLAGEAAGKWAIKNSLPFPFLGQQVELQETGRDLFPEQIMQSPPAAQAAPDFAMSWQLRRSMRQRVISVKPEWHEGLGLEVYSQVTSPLRRYADLLAHIQISAVIRNREILSAQELSLRLAAGEAAYQAVVQAERASKRHWTMVYLCDKKDSSWNAVALGKSGSLWNIVIPSIALETQVNLRGRVAPNDKIKVILKSVNVPESNAMFAGE